ncbi:MAG: hypothetical protein WKF57_01580 [Nakamurella sp.]
MTRVELLNARYERSAALAVSGVELVAVGEPHGAAFDDALRKLFLLVRDDMSGLWDDLLGAAKALRWRHATQPQPLQFNPAVQQMSATVAAEASMLRPAVGSEVREALTAVAATAAALAEHDPFLGAALFEAIEESGFLTSVVIGANGAAVAGLTNWLTPFGVAVYSTSQLVREQRLFERAYAVGPPRFMPASLVTAPLTEALSYYVPAWFSDRSIPRSPLADLAEGTPPIKRRDFVIGDTSSPTPTDSEETLPETTLLPAAVWIPPDAPSREPGRDEVAARRVLLSGGYAILLDDGERIRSVDPTQPGGERVTNVDVKSVRPGIYLLLRDGETERLALYDAAIRLMGTQASAVAASQARWKAALQSRFDQYGQAWVLRELSKLGVRRLDRVRAWIEPTLVRPRSHRDFALLLEWLGVPVNATFPLANALNKKRSQASVNIAEQLEDAIGAADLAALERDGHLRFAVQSAGFRGVIATRVLSISPYVEIVLRHDARVLSTDRSATWLE